MQESLALDELAVDPNAVVADPSGRHCLSRGPGRGALPLALASYDSGVHWETWIKISEIRDDDWDDVPKHIREQVIDQAHARLSQHIRQLPWRTSLFSGYLSPVLNNSTTVRGT